MCNTFLVSCARNSINYSSEGFEDVLGGFGPDEWFGVRVPVLDPGADVGFEGIDTAVVAAADELLGEVQAPTRAPTTRRS